MAAPSSRQGSFVAAPSSQQGSFRAPVAALYAPAPQNLTVTPSVRSFGSSRLEVSESYVPPTAQTSPSAVPRSFSGTAPSTHSVTDAAPGGPSTQGVFTTAQLAPPTKPLSQTSHSVAAIQAAVPWVGPTIRAAPRQEATSSLGGHERTAVLEDAVVVARLQAELEQFRVAAAEREQRMVEITTGLQEERESRARAEREKEELSAQVALMAAEINIERVAREQAEAAASESQAVLQQERARCSRQAQPAHERSPSARPPAVSRMASRGSSRDRFATGYTDLAGKDDIDSRLLGWLEQNGASLTFRRKNRGWYAFRRTDETGPLSADRCVELSIVSSGKLMAKVEPSANDAGWNNGKCGAMERFVAYFSALEN